MDSMSSGLKSLRREIGAEPNAWLSGPDETWLLTRTPSTKISGLLPSERLALPRIRICDPVPTWPEVVDRDYHEWDSERLVIDTARTGVDEAVRTILHAMRSRT